MGHSGQGQLRTGEVIYRHKKTGAVIDVSSTMGGDWQEVKPAGTPPDPAHGKPEAKAPVRKSTAKGGKNNGIRNDK